MKRALEQYYKQSIQDVGAINIGNSSGRKLVFSINGKRLFAKEVPFSLPLLRKYQLLKSKAAHIPEAVIPQDIIPFSQTTMIVVSEFIAGDTLDIVYASLSNQDRVSRGEKTGDFLRRLHANIVLSYPDGPQLEEDRVRQIINTYVRADKQASLYKLIDARKNHVKRTQVSLIHRDIRPQNIICEETSNIKIIDFENAEFSAPLYDLSLCLMLSPKYHEFTFGVIQGYFNGTVPNSFWTEEKEHIAWQLLEYSCRYRNDNASIQKKFDLLIDYLTGDAIIPDWWDWLLNDGGMSQKFSSKKESSQT